MRILCNFLSAKKNVNSDLIRTHFLMIIFDIIYHVYQHMWVDSANKKYSELESLATKLHLLQFKHEIISVAWVFSTISLFFSLTL